MPGAALQALVFSGRRWGKRMRIGIFTDTYKPEINGVVTSIELFRRQLEASGHTVYLVCPRYFGREDPTPNVFRFPSSPYLFKMMTERRFAYPSLRVFRAISRLNLDIVHSQVPANIGVFGILAARLRRAAHVHTYHTLFMEYTHYMPLPQTLSRYLVRLISRRFCGRCHRVISPSKRIGDELRHYGVNTPIDVIPTGIDIREPASVGDPSDLRRRYHIPPEKHLLSMVGRIGREKNISFLLRVVLTLKLRRSDFTFVVVGDGPDRKPLQQEVKELGLEDCVVFTGYVRRDEVFAFLRASSVFTFASVTETQGLVLLEAMSMETPVVAVDAMGVSDLMADERGGFTCRLKIDEFAGHVQELLDDRELHRAKSREARRKAIEWSIETMTARLVSTYERAIADFKTKGHLRYGKHRALNRGAASSAQH